MYGATAFAAVVSAAAAAMPGGEVEVEEDYASYGDDSAPTDSSYGGYGYYY